jgi:hypothetical protein
VRGLAAELPVAARTALATGAGAIAYAAGLRLLAPGLWRRAQALVLGLLPGAARRAAP